MTIRTASTLLSTAAWFVLCLAFVVFGGTMRTTALQNPSPPRENRSSPRNTPGESGGGQSNVNSANPGAQGSANPPANSEGTNTSNGRDSGQVNANHNPPNGGDEGLTDTLSAWLRPALIALSVVGGLLLLAYLVSLLVKTYNAGLAAQKTIAVVLKRQDELNKQISAALSPLTNEIKDINTRVRDMQNELTNLSMSQRAERRRTNDDPARTAPPSYAAFAAVPGKANDEQFPVAADEYLNKVRAQAAVLKPDFANGILIKDPDGRGELVLVRDAMVPGEPPLNYIVPRVTKFQTQQDFYSYYEKYYECQRPSAGEIWIVTPAVVDRVDGGWRLREKGELEVR